MSLEKNREIILSFIIFSLDFYLATSGTEKMNRTEYPNEFPLPDYLHSFLPTLPRKFVDAPIFLGLILKLCFLWFLPPEEKKAYFLESSLFHLMLSLTRFIFYRATPLPSLKNEKEKEKVRARVQKRGLLGNSFGGIRDLMFSGHVSSALMQAILMYKYAPGSIFVSLAFSLVGIQAFLSIATRSHYTIDVLVAFLVPLVLVPLAEKERIFLS